MILKAARPGRRASSRWRGNSAMNPNETKEHWQEKIAKALAARRAGQEMRKGKPSTISKIVKIEL